MQSRIVLISIIVLLAIAPGQVSHSQSEKNTSSLVLLSFDVGQAGSFAVLKDGLRNMLSSRLAGKKEIRLVENSLKIEEQSRFLSLGISAKKDVFAQMAVDYIAATELLEQEKSLLLRMTFYAMEGGEPVVVTMEAEGQEQIISGIDTLAEQIAVQVFGRQPAAAAEQSAVAAGIDAFRTEHPDKKYKEEIVSGPALLQGGGTMSISGGDLVRRRATLSSPITALAVDREKEEIVIASETDLRVYRFERGILQQLAEHVFKPAIKVHSIDLADLDGDGSPEILVSGVADDAFSSAVFSLSEEAGIRQLMGGIRYGIRALELPGEGLVVAGQAKAKIGDSFLDTGVYVLDINPAGGSVTPRQKIVLPAGVNLFDFVFADLDGDGEMEIVAITSTMKMAVYDQEYMLVWLSEADYGGSVNSLGKLWNEKPGTPVTGYGVDNENYIPLHYLPTRLIAADVNNDGRTEIITGSNILSTFRALHNLRSFSGGNIVCLGWDGQAMNEQWKTDLLSGYVVDYALQADKDVLLADAGGEMKGGKKLRLYVGQLAAGGFSSILNFGAEKARLHLYEFNIADESVTTP